MKNQSSLSLGILLLVFAVMSLFTLSYYLFNMSFFFDTSNYSTPHIKIVDEMEINNKNNDNIEDNASGGATELINGKGIDAIALDIAREQDEQEFLEMREANDDDIEKEDISENEDIQINDDEEEVIEAGNVNGALLKGSSRKRIKVCTVASNKRQSSIFRNDLMSSLGSKKYYYSLKSEDECAWDWPSVIMIPFVRCCSSMTTVISTINEAMEKFDVVIITGDEFCAVKDIRPHFRQYHGDGMMEIGMKVNLTKSGVVQFTQFFPLGPRYEFERVTKKDIMHSAPKRLFLYNFLGSLTSPSRHYLEVVLEKLDKKRAKDYPNESLSNPSKVSTSPRQVTSSAPLPFKAYVHVTDKWRTKITESSGYVSPDVYRRVLLQSVFTLCPTGHNPEAYRIYEACEAGSIPILSLDKWYNEHECKNAFYPFIRDGAPFIWLESWSQLGDFLSSVNATFVAEKQKQVRAWYSKWMNDQAFKLEEVMEWRYSKRMARGKPTTTL